MSSRLSFVCLLLAPNTLLHAEAPRRDRYGDPLPPGVIARLGTPRLRHFGGASDVAFSPDGKILASAGQDHRIRLWDAATGKQLRALPGHPNWVRDIAFSPNGKMLASSGLDQTTRLWNVATGRQIGEPILPGALFWCFSPDSKIMVFTKAADPSRVKNHTEEFVYFWGIAMGKITRAWKIKAITYAAALSPDGRNLAILTHEWGAKDNKKDKNGDPIAENTAILNVWETATGKELWRGVRNLEAVNSLAFSPDGKTLVTGGEYFDPYNNVRHGKITFWDAADGKELRQLPELTNRVWCVRFSADGKYLAAICDRGPVLLWDVKAAKEPRRVWQASDSGGSLAFAPDSRRLAWCTRQAIRTIDLPPPQTPTYRGGHTGSIPFVAFGSDGKTIISAGDRVRIWNADTGEELRATSQLLRECALVAISPDRQTLITGSRSGTTLWDLATLKSLRTFATPNDFVLAMALSPDGKTLAVNLEHAIAPGEETERLKVGWPTRRSMVQLWDVQSGKEKPPLRTGIAVAHLAFSPDGGRLVGVPTYPYNLIRFWDTKTGKVSLEVKSYTSEWPGKAALCFSPDGNLLASAEKDHSIRLLDAHSGNEVRVLRAHHENIHTMVFSPDGKTLLSSSEDETLRLWDVATGQCLYELIGHQAKVTAAAFSPDGKRIVSASADTTILIWDVPRLAKLIRPPRPPLTEDEFLCLWTDLGGPDYLVNRRALRRLLTDPQTALAFVKQRLKPEPPRDDRLPRLLADLDSDSFVVRENASRELARMGKGIGPALRRALDEKLSPEQRQRVRALLDKIAPPRRPPPRQPHPLTEEQQRLVRVAILLDRMGSDAAVDLLRFLVQNSELKAILNDRYAQGSDFAEAKEALKRLAERPAKR